MEITQAHLKKTQEHLLLRVLSAGSKKPLTEGQGDRDAEDIMLLVTTGICSFRGVQKKRQIQEMISIRKIT